jgi:hypothetical protein
MQAHLGLPALCATIERHAAMGHHSEALELFRLTCAMGPFTPLLPTTYHTLIFAAAALQELGAAAVVTWHMDNSGIKMDVYTHNYVLGMYLSCGMLREAWERKEARVALLRNDTHRAIRENHSRSLVLISKNFKKTSRWIVDLGTHKYCSMNCFDSQ